MAIVLLKLFLLLVVVTEVSGSERFNRRLGGRRLGRLVLTSSLISEYLSKHCSEVFLYGFLSRNHSDLMVENLGLFIQVQHFAFR